MEREEAFGRSLTAIGSGVAGLVAAIAERSRPEVTAGADRSAPTESKEVA